MQEREAPGVDHDGTCERLVSWLRMVELSGTDEVFLPRAADDDFFNTLTEEVSGCTRCELHKTRTNVVFGEGNLSGRLMFVGEAPGRDEDLQGRPFVGRAGQLLTRIIQAMGMDREDVYITNVLKCRPPGNRNPDIDEIVECMPYLERQIDAIQPEIICTLGLFATQTLTGIKDPISRMRGNTYDYNGIPVIPTYHPAALLRNAANKKPVWEDMKRVMRKLGLPMRGVMRNGAG